MEEKHFEVFYGTISSLYRNIQRIRLIYAEKFGIKSVQLFWIFLLREHPEGMIASELAQASQINRSLISREVKDLVDRGLVYYEKDSNTQYARKIYLSKEGKKLAENIDEIAMSIQKGVSKEIPVEDMDVFYQVLSILNQRFNEWDDEEMNQ